MRTSKRTKLLTDIILKTNKAQVKVQKHFFLNTLALPTSRLEHIAKNVSVKNRGREIVVP
jgi:hypothetical protein